MRLRFASAMLTATRRGIALAVIAHLCFFASAQADDWLAYTNMRFGFAFSHPAALKPGPGPANGAGRTFTDGKFSVTVQAHFSMRSLDETWKQIQADYGKNATYKVKKPDWFVISGILPDGTEFYRKFHEGNGSWCELWATYPHSMNETYDPVLERMVKSFRPFLPGDDYDRAAVEQPK